MSIVAYVPDLMDRSKFTPVSGVSVTSQLQGLQADADVAVADLSRLGAIEALAAAPASRRVGFLSHIDSENRTKAQELGIEVYPRSRFFSRIVAILTQGEQPGADIDE